MTGIISKEERQSISNLNGHNSRTVQRHYIYHDRAQDTKHAMGAFSLLQDHNLNASSSSSSTSSHHGSHSSLNISPRSSTLQRQHSSPSNRNYTSSPIRQMDSLSPPTQSIHAINDVELTSQHALAENFNLDRDGNIQTFLSSSSRTSINQPFFIDIKDESTQVIDLVVDDNESNGNDEGMFYSSAKISADEWGSKHPDGRKVDARKSQWSSAEISYIKDWCDKTLREHPQWLPTIRSKCLHHILGDPKARPIFHQNHIINGRITHGYNVAYGLN